jgi:copper chaperone CopZ
MRIFFGLDGICPKRLAIFSERSVMAHFIHVVNNLILKFEIVLAYKILVGKRMKKVEISIEGMSCLNHAVHVQRALSAVPTVTGVGVTIGMAIVEHDTSDEQLLRAIGAAGNYKGRIGSGQKPLKSTISLDEKRPVSFLSKKFASLH